MKYFLAIFLLVFFISCDEEKEDLTAQQIIDKAIERSGGEKYESSIINFTFRNASYSSIRKNGEYELRKKISDSLGEIEDVLSNSGFNRFINGNKLELADSTKNKYSNAVNSVHYFVQLPYGLNDPAVKKELVGKSKIQNVDYYNIKVSFSEEGGGDDHDDIYMYWVSQNDFTVDFFAYKFYTGKGGIRFREAYNPRTIEGIRFVDYRNYKIEPWKDVDLTDLGNLFENEKLELLSDIKTVDITVSKSE